MKILLLEDNLTDAGLTIRALKKAWPQCTIEHVSLVKEAHKILAAKPGYDIALLDMQMPDGNGLDILMEIRHKKLDIAVAMLTGSGDEEVAVAALKAGADDYTVKKPGYTDKVPHLVELALENHRQYREHESSAINVLYIEHNIADVDFTRRHLARYAPYIRLIDVPDGEKALELLPETGIQPEEWDYHLIIMDYLLPGMNALELVKEIRQERKLDLPIVIVTGQGNEDVAVQALKVGASEYLVKRENYLTRLPSLIAGAYQNCQLKRKQKALAESEAKYRLLAENSGDVIFTLDLNLNYTYVSPAVKAMRGYEPEEAMKQKIEEVLTPESYQRAVKIISESLFIDHKLLKNPFPKHIIELEMIRKDQTTIWTEVLASLIVDDNKVPTGILGVSRDISKRKAALDELRKLSSAVEQSPDSVIITNLKGEIEYCNPSVVNISGYSKEEIIGENPRIFSSGNKTKDEYKQLWHTITKGDIWEGEFQNKKKTGELYWEATTISPVIDSKGKITHYLAIRKDITDQKRMTRELIEAKEHAEQSDRLKSAFLANMSHEIRTPLNGILGFTELMVDPDFDANHKIEMARLILENGELLLGIINDVLDISKIEAGQITLNKTTFDAHKLISTVFNSFSLKAKKKKLSLIVATDNNSSRILLNSDFMRLNQVLSNLVGNALKYTEKGRVEMGCLKKESEVVFYVKDTGIGIADEFKERIFERFNQQEAFTKKVGGNGLGLAIAKSFVEMLGGKIWVESEEGNGSTFYFTIPVDSM